MYTHVSGHVHVSYMIHVAVLFVSSNHMYIVHVIHVFLNRKNN